MNYKYDIYDEVTLVTAIKVKMLKFLGHVQRMADEREPREALNEKPQKEEVTKSRPNSRWIDEVENNFRRLGVTRWKTKADGGIVGL
ncbi:hypothetical protein C0J52_00137 [Blattella germanica]|nr:hypothetical protein C0J52_00137 [Blattella germanica]